VSRVRITLGLLVVYLTALLKRIRKEASSEEIISECEEAKVHSRTIEPQRRRKPRRGTIITIIFK
jgi:hypothetical protein